MNYDIIKGKLQNYKVDEVTVYISYLRFLESDNKDGVKVNKWFGFFTEQQAIDIYIKVAKDGVYIDGETITLQFKGKVMASYDYHAYKNRVLNIYPESIFDIENVYEGDKFSFRKENGKIIYSHAFGNPFVADRKLIGCYCIIRNSRGEFIETLDLKEIMKMRAVAKTKKVWDTWFSQMSLKSVIKRACKIHFKDITGNMDNIDNEQNDPERLTIDEVIQKKIETASFVDLGVIYKEDINNVSDKEVFMKLLGERKQELKDLLPNITKEDYAKALEMLKEGKKMENLLLIWKIDEDTQNELLTQI